MGLFLNFGAGPNQLPEPWQNLNAAHDIRKRLRFEDGSASAILAEHVIEHVPFLAGFGFLQECWRVLEPGGVLRLAFPDAARFIDYPRMPQAELHPNLLRYARALEQRDQGGLIRGAASGHDKQRAALLMLFAGWEHQAAWSIGMAAAALFAHGFLGVTCCVSASGRLAGVDGHHLEVGEEIARLETSILEAVK